MLRTSQVIRNMIHSAQERTNTFNAVDLYEFQHDMDTLETEMSTSFEDWKREQIDASVAAYGMVEAVVSKYLSGDMLQFYMGKIIDALYEDLSVSLKSVGIQITKEEAENSPFSHLHCTSDVTILYDGKKMWVGDQYTDKNKTFAPTEAQIAAYMQLLAEKHHNSWVQ